MPNVVMTPVQLAWRDAGDLALQVGMPWRDGTLITSLGSGFLPPAPPPGSTATAPNTNAGFIFDIASTRSIAHTVVVTDLRDDTVLPITGLSISTDADSIVWTLQGQSRGDLFERLTTGDEQAALSVTIDGYRWDFLVEDVQRTRSFNDSSLTISCRSQTVIAGAPYQYAQNWINDGPTTAAQIADQAQIYTEVEIDWQLEDWLVPDGVWSLTGTPLDVIKNVADAAGAIAQSDPTENRVSITPRYLTLPNEWPYLAPDIEIHLSATLVDGFQRADQPSYNGVYVSGQQQGVVCWVHFAWTTGARLAPMITDSLITEEAAGSQRGMAFLGGMGPQAKVTVTLPFMTEYGPVPLSSLVRVVDPGAIPPVWYGMVRAVSISAALPSVTQQITIERHLGDIDGDEAVIKLPAPGPTPAPTPSPPPPPPPPPTGFSGRLGWYAGAVEYNASSFSPSARSLSSYSIETKEFYNVGKDITVSGVPLFALVASIVPSDGISSVEAYSVSWQSSWTPGVFPAGAGQAASSPAPAEAVIYRQEDLSKFLNGEYVAFIISGYGHGINNYYIGTLTLTASVGDVNVPGSLTAAISLQSSGDPNIPDYLHLVLSGSAT